MKKIVRMSIAAAMMMGVGSVSAQAEGLSVVNNVYVKGEIRPRYEMVDDNSVDAKANALTNRFVVGAGADLFDTSWMSGYVEMTDVSSLNGNYNDKNGNGAGYPVVADPQQTRLTQSYVDLTYKKTKLRVGRQLIKLDNERFIGPVGWRQMFQTYDAYTVTDHSIKNLNVFASFVTQRNTVVAKTLATRDLLINVSYKVSSELKATAYSYMLGSIHDTYGLALTGVVPVSSSLKVDYRAEYASQNDATLDSANGIRNAQANADYYRLNLGMNYSGILASVGYESLSGTDGNDGKSAFTTPYATLHGQNGWADKFLNTPSTGIEDATVMVGFKSSTLGLAKIVFHDFQSEVGSINYGKEYDFLYKNKVPGIKGLNGMLKAAVYNAGDTVAEGNTQGSLAIDTTKFWVMLDYKFSSK